MCFIGHEELAVSFFPRKQGVVCVSGPVGSGQQQAAHCKVAPPRLVECSFGVFLEASRKENLLKLGMAFLETQGQNLASDADVVGLRFHYPTVTLSPE